LTRGRPRQYNDPLVVTLKCEKDLHDIMATLRVQDSDVYQQGAIRIATERSDELTEQQIAILIQAHRQIIKDYQEKIMLLERVAIDAKVREQARKKARTETRYDDRGQAYLVVESP